MLNNYGKLRPQHRMMDLVGSNINQQFIITLCIRRRVMPQVKHYRSNLYVAVLQYT